MAWDAGYPASVKTLHVYLMRQILATLLVTVAVFTFVLLLANGLQDILTLLINRQTSLGGVIKAIGLLMPWVLVFSLPMGMMTAALLVFGRFSADQELTAARSSGISLVALITPILFLSLLLCGLSAWINLKIAPESRVAYKNMVRSMGQKITTSALPEGRVVRDIKGYVFYIGQNDGQKLHDIYICRLDADQHIDLTIQAPSGKIETVDGKSVAVLLNAQTMYRLDNGMWSPGEDPRMEIPITPTGSGKTDSSIALSDMTYAQLQDQLASLEQAFGVTSMKKLDKDELRQQKSSLDSVKKDATTPVRFQMHMKVATSFACFGFTLIGIPLGIRAHRRESVFNLAMAIALVFIYYAFVIVGQSLQARTEFAPQLIVWLPNFIFQVTGAVMLWRANKGI